MFAASTSRWFSAVAVVVFWVTLGLSNRAAAQSESLTWIDLPRALGDPADEKRRNRTILDIGLVDVLVSRGGDEWVRAFYRTKGHFEDPTIFPSNLRAVAMRGPIGDLSSYDGMKWPEGPMGSENWIIEDRVSKWNKALASPPPAAPSDGDKDDGDPLFRGKKGGKQGIISTNGTVFVNTTATWVKFGSHTRGWNGLSQVDGTALARVAFTQELWSFGGQDDPLTTRAKPEGNEVAVTNDGSRFVFAANYCGADASGVLHVQDISNLGAVDPTKYADVDLIERLAVYTPTAPSSDGLGPEVAPFGTGGFADPAGPVGGNKFRQIHAVWVKDDPAYDNRGRLLLFAMLNLDPVEIIGTPAPLPPLVPLDDSNTDDGKYDYLAVTDITDMTSTTHTPVHPKWNYDDLAKWTANTKFLRVPPDVKPGWDWSTGVAPVGDGYDWSEVEVFYPGNPTISATERILGSGTPSNITSHPDGTWVYLVSVDQGIELTNDHDGGWHVPHLYAIDLSAADFTNQDSLETYSPMITKYRFNKVIYHDFGSGVLGAKLIPATIPGMPNDMTDPTWKKHPGEHLYDPTGQTRLIVVRNCDFSSKDRLYVGAQGKATLGTDPSNWVGAATVHVFSLPTLFPGVPTWLNTAPLPKTDTGNDYYLNHGLAPVPNNWLADTIIPRNVILIAGYDSDVGVDGKDRLFAFQDIE